MLGDEWIVNRPGMGYRSNVSRAVAAFRDPGDVVRKKLQKRLHICADPCPNGLTLVLGLAQARRLSSTSEETMRTRQWNQLLFPRTEIRESLPWIDDQSTE